MDDNKLRFGVGVLVIAALGLGIILTFLFGAFPTVLNREYLLTVDFPSAEGVSTNTPVLRDGVRIGRVTDIKLLEKQGVQIVLAMDPEYKLTHEYIPRIGVGSVISGDAKLEFVRASPEQLAKLDSELIPQLFADGDYIQYGKKSQDPFNLLFTMEEELVGTMQSIRRAGNSIDRAGSGFTQIVENVQGVVGNTDTKIDNVAAEAVKALEEFQGAMREVRQIIGSEKIREDLENSIDQIPETLKEIREALVKARSTFDSFETAGKQFQRVGVEAEGVVKDVREITKPVKSAVETIERTFNSAEKTVQNIEKFTKPLGERGDEIVDQVVTTLRNIDSALVQVEAFGDALNNSDGTIKRLLQDDEIYWQIRRTITNIERASAKIRPIMDDVRIFSDKIARDPRELGVRGALNKRPSGLGLK